MKSCTKLLLAKYWVTWPVFFAQIPIQNFQIASVASDASGLPY